MFPVRRDKGQRNKGAEGSTAPSKALCPRAPLSLRFFAPETHQAGFTLVELLIALSVTAMVTLVLGGLAFAVQTAREHTQGLHQTAMQAQATIRRIRYMVAQAGVYQRPQEPTTLGLAVISRKSSSAKLPEILVVWSGRRVKLGQGGGMADEGLQQRLPRMDELVVYAPDPEDSSHLVEIAFPQQTSRVDFRSTGFAERIQQAIAAAPAKQRRQLCDRIRQSRLDGETLAANVRFELISTPREDDIKSTDAGSEDWNNLMWAGGIVADESGLRQARLRIELQIATTSPSGSGTLQAPSLPYFGSASYRYVYRTAD